MSVSLDDSSQDALDDSQTSFSGEQDSIVEVSVTEEQFNCSLKTVHGI